MVGRKDFSFGVEKAVVGFLGLWGEILWGVRGRRLGKMRSLRGHLEVMMMQERIWCFYAILSKKVMEWKVWEITSFYSILSSWLDTFSNRLVMVKNGSFSLQMSVTTFNPPTIRLGDLQGLYFWIFKWSNLIWSLCSALSLGFIYGLEIF